MGLSRFELLTPRLSSVCSNQLSYRPSFLRRLQALGALGVSYSTRFSKHRLVKEPWAQPLVPSKLDRAFASAFAREASYGEINQLLNIRSIFRFSRQPAAPKLQWSEGGPVQNYL